MKIAQRIGAPLYYDEHSYKKLISFLERNRDCFDELALFTSFSAHGALPLEHIRTQAAVIRERISDLKRRGFPSVGLNVQVTLGHLDEDYEFYGQPFQPIVGYKGDSALSCFCPESPEMKNYLKEKYRIFAETEPDFMWIDDDIKFFWNGVKFGCFCPNCMNRFNRRMQTNYTRETLVEAMEEPDAIDLRAAWVQDIRDRITDLLSMIGDAVRQVHPHMRLGFQTQHQGWCTYNGMDFAAWFPALGATMGRPGEGFYDDKMPISVCQKALSTARQAEEYPASVNDVQYELENFPTYSTIQKSCRMNIAELTLAIAQGMNGLLLNSFPDSAVVLNDDLSRLYAHIRDIRPNWELMEQFAHKSIGVGFYPAFSSKYDQRRPLHHGQSFFQTNETTADHNVMQTYSLSTIGIPMTVDSNHAYGAVFTGDLSDGFTDDELLEFLSRSVILDHKAVRAFERRDLSKYLGVRCATEDLADSVFESFTDHPINIGLEGYGRNVHPAYFGGGGAALLVIDENVEVLSHLVRPSFGEANGNVRKGECLGPAATLYENSLGGRVCVLAYAAWQRVESYARLMQMQRISEYLCKNRPMTKFMSPHPAAQFVRKTEDGIMVTIVNLSLDVMEDMHFSVLNAGQARCLYRGNAEVMTAEPNGEYGVFLLPPLLPYETCTLIAK